MFGLPFWMPALTRNAEPHQDSASSKNNLAGLCRPSSSVDRHDVGGGRAWDQTAPTPTEPVERQMIDRPDG